MTALTTAELADQLEAANASEENCRLALERLQIESATAGDAPGKAERDAEAALATASATTARLAAAVVASEARDRAAANAAATAQADQQDKLTVETLANVEKLATKLAAAVEGYVRAYDGLLRGVASAQQFVNENPRLSSSDTWLPRPDTLTSEEIGRIATQGAQPPGSAFHSAQYPDVSRIEPIAQRYASYARFFKDQLTSRRTPRVAA